MASIILKSGNTLLDYAISTSPDPIQITTGTGNAAQALIQIVVSNKNPNVAIYVDQLQITLPIGLSGARNLSTEANLEGGIVITGTGDADPDWVPTPSSNGIIFVCNRETATLTTTGLIISLYGIDVSNIAGAFELSIIESASTDVDLAPSQVQSNIYVIGKFAPQPYLSEFWAEAPQVAWGGSAVLNWVCAHNAGCTVTFGYQTGMATQNATMPQIGSPAPATITVSIPSGQHTLTVTGLKATTTFLLKVTETSGNQSVDLYGSVTVTVQNNQNYVPIGTIALWSCSNSRTTIPAGWQICNGTNGTPDLRDRFIVGAGSSNYRVDDHGDGDTHQHSITIPPKSTNTEKGGKHSHGFPSNWYDNHASSGNRVTIIDRHATSVKDATTTTDGEHTHPLNLTFPVFNSGNSSPSVLRPKWYALYYIMRIS